MTDTRKMNMAQQYEILDDMRRNADALMAQLLIDATAILHGSAYPMGEPNIQFPDGSVFDPKQRD